MLEFMKLEHMETCTNDMLIRYKQSLDAYRKMLLRHVYDYRDTYALIQRVLRDREENLQIELICAEDDRLSADSSVLYVPDNIH